jgi:Zn-dependent M28 family amino/carboxypeptidase
VNLIALCAGTDRSRPAIVLSAHYDHLGIRDGRMFPGADDNASGVATVLEIARACVARPFRHDLIVAVFDAEEMGLQGARAFVASPPVPSQRIALDVNLDMIARGDKGELYASGIHHHPSLKPLLAPVFARAPIKVLFGHDLPGTGHEDWTMQSDHGVFHQAGIPFVYFGVEDHPDYHQPTDTADRINQEFFANAATVVLASLRALDAGLK